MYDDVITHEQIQQMFSEESNDIYFFGFESTLLILVGLICGFDSRGGLLVLKQVHLISECDLHASIYSIYLLFDFGQS